ncbi:DUF2079 domain-containing protein [Dactylosporangium sucinum]|uniref:DUF2079 domain-containing protein n=1 Tax=Dactylosporangium sucinum TaxID=1424081 RepID=A0A917WHP2_9ACTN|nr:DUF2079 domain-containing protein [Dactylosporangium sucinum]GGM04898.1 hypothetical protein GCM10007977_002610 [Dactylosporangium sucinum]
MTRQRPAIASDDGVAPVGSRRERGHTVALTALMLAASLLYATVSLNRFRTWRASTYDLVIFDQAVRSYAHGQLPVAIVKGVHNGFGPDFSVLGDHVSPVLVLLAPLYLVYDDPRTLLVAQAVLLACAIAPLWRFTRRELGVTAAYGAAAAYALSWPVAGAVSFDFHEVAFAPLLLAVLFDQLSMLRHGAGRGWRLALAAAAVLCVKEDLGLALAGVGLCLLLPYRGRPPGRGDVLLGLGCLLGGPAYTAFATQVIIPAFGGRPDYYWSYDHLGPTVPAALWHVVSQPVDAWYTVTHPATKINTMLLLLAVGALTPLVSPYLAVTLPLLAERMLSESPGWWGTGAQYNAFLVIPLLCAGVDGAARIARRWPSRRVATAWTVTVVTVAGVALPNFAFRELFRTSAWRQTDDMRAAAHAAAHIPDAALVETASSIGPQLTSRTQVLLWDRTPRWAPWVVADITRPQFPFCSIDDQRARVELLRSHGYRIVFQENDFVVLHNPSAVPELFAPPAPPCA